MATSRAMTAQTVAEKIHATTLASYTPTGNSGTVFIDRNPAGKGSCVTVSHLGGEDYTPTHPESSAEFQVRVKGEEGKPTSAFELAANLSTALHNAYRESWGSAHSFYIVYSSSGIPAFMGEDNNGCPEYVFRLVVRYRNKDAL